MATLDAAGTLCIGTVTTAPSPATSGSSMVVTLLGGCTLPTAPFDMTVWPNEDPAVGPLISNAEIIRVTAYSQVGNVATLSTIGRAQLGTNARTIIAGDWCAQTISPRLIAQLLAILVLFEADKAGLVSDPGTPSGKFLRDDNTFQTIGGGGDLLAANNLNDVASKPSSFANIKQAATTSATGVVELATDGENAANVVVQGNDSRLSNARTPSAHAASHASGGGDPVTLAESQITNLASDLAAKQALAANLTAIAALVSAANKLIRFSGSGTADLLDFSTSTSLAGDSDTAVPSQHAVKAYVDAAVTGLLDFKGAIDASANPNYPAASKGDTYVVTVAGKVGGASGKSVDVGDMVLAIADNAGGSEAAVGTSWVVLEHNLAGALLAANNLSDLTNAGTGRTNLGLSANGSSFVTAADYAAMRVLLGLVIGTNVQAYDADLTTWAGITPGTGVATQLAIALDGLSSAALGTLGILSVVLSADATVAAANNSKCFDHTSGSPHTLTIDSNANLALPIGFTFSIDNGAGAGVVSIVITSDTLVLAGAGTTGTRTLAANGFCTARKSAATVWKINGTGLT